MEIGDVVKHLPYTEGLGEIELILFRAGAWMR